MDTLTAEERSEVMSRVAGKNTRPELAVRRAAYALGYRYRLHRRDLPGCPDLTLAPLKKVIFVHGCFWHRHPGCPRTRTPKSNTDFWVKKFDQNVKRDRQSSASLHKAGWKVLTVWECQTEDELSLRRLLSRFLGRRS